MKLMATLFALVLLITATAQIASASGEGAEVEAAAEGDPSPSDCSEFSSLGREAAAASHSSFYWFLGGVGSGLMLGPLGPVAMIILAARTDPQPDQVPPEADASCYLAGYGEQAKSENKRSGIWGSLVGLAIVFGLYYSVGR
jgi:hypothetical protein